MFTKKLTKFAKKHKKLIYSFLGFVIVFQLLFLLIWLFAIIDSIIYHRSEYPKEPLRADKMLVTTDDERTAIEMEVLLAKHGLRVLRMRDGTKTVLILPKYRCAYGKRHCTANDYDLAILVLAKSGIFDKKSGLETFNKFDFLSTKEEKKQKAVQDINNELARLIKRLECIEDATVVVTIPDQEIFARNQKPVTAVVQIETLSQDLLNGNTVRTIKNILIGSVSGLSEDNITLTDIQGNTYY